MERLWGFSHSDIHRYRAPVYCIPYKQSNSQMALSGTRIQMTRGSALSTNYCPKTTSSKFCQSRCILNICHFWYVTASSRPVEVRQKVCKFATKQPHCAKKYAVLKKVRYRRLWWYVVTFMSFDKVRITSLSPAYQQCIDFMKQNFVFFFKSSMCIFQ